VTTVSLEEDVVDDVVELFVGNVALVIIGVVVGVGGAVVIVDGDVDNELLVVIVVVVSCYKQSNYKQTQFPNPYHS
jgi:hypothetical protein